MVGALEELFNRRGGGKDSEGWCDITILAFFVVKLVRFWLPQSSFYLRLNFTFVKKEGLFGITFQP